MYNSSHSFSGEFIHQLDEKGRVKLPTKLLNTLLDEFGRECRVIRMPERCLAIYPKKYWEEGWSEVLAKLGPKVPGSSDARALTRIAGATRMDISIAAQGRISLSESFRRHIGVGPGDNVAVIGAETRIEIWREETWQQYLEEQMSRFEEIAERITSQVNGQSHSEGEGQ